ncbi:MAG: ABC transporter permease subunit [Bilophila sp.]
MNTVRHPALLWTRQLVALMGKESKQIVRDPSSYLVAAVLPMIFLLLFGYGITLDAGVMDIVVLDESDSAAGMAIRTDFAHSPNFRVHSAKSREDAARMMRDSVISGFVVIPSDFASLLLRTTARNEGAPIQVIVSGSEPNTAQFIRGYSQGVISNWAQARMKTGKPAQNALEVVPRYWFNPAAQSRWFLVPGSITVVMTLIGTMLTALVIAREYERGTMEALFATPVSRMQILLGKCIPYYFLGMFSMILCALAGVFLFEVPLRGSVFALFLLSSAFLMPALGQGLLISILTKEQLLAAQTGLITGFLPAIILSGFIFDINSMPTFLQYLTLLIPARHFNVALQTVFLAGDIWAIFLPGMAYMLGLAAIFLALTYHKLVKRLDA